VFGEAGEERAGGGGGRGVGRVGGCKRAPTAGEMKRGRRGGGHRGRGGGGGCGGEGRGGHTGTTTATRREIKRCVGRERSEG